MVDSGAITAQLHVDPAHSSTTIQASLLYQRQCATASTATTIATATTATTAANANAATAATKLSQSAPSVQSALIILRP